MNLGHCNDTLMEARRYNHSNEWIQCAMKNQKYEFMRSQPATLAITCIESFGIICNCLILITFKVISIQVISANPKINQIFPTKYNPQEMRYIRSSTLVWLHAIASSNLLYSISQFSAFDLEAYLHTYYRCTGKHLCICLSTNS